MDNETLHMTMLFDFFGDLLTDKQREYYDMYHNDDLSLSEIAEAVGISKQGVYDIVKRAEKALSELEHKTGVVKKWVDAQAVLEQAEANANRLLAMVGGDAEASALVREIVLDISTVRES
ncbi:MAG: YlxM family DNA-binding protein [Oscillospiraceae bacterium]|nr:YlxM family DNA-binding protein [Oscillospiraceae bacterium]